MSTNLVNNPVWARKHVFIYKAGMEHFAHSLEIEGYETDKIDNTKVFIHIWIRIGTLLWNGLEA